MALYRFFDQRNWDHSEEARILYARFELAYTTVDFLAAFLFIVGSILFFKPSTTYAATWMFLIGSFFFAVKPTLRLVREVKLYKLHKYQKLAERSKA